MLIVICLYIEQMFELLSELGGAQGTIANLTPHAHALEGFRIVMLEGGGAADVLPQVGILLGFAVVFFGVAAWMFRFEKGGKGERGEGKGTAVEKRS